MTNQSRRAYPELAERATAENYSRHASRWAALTFAVFREGVFTIREPTQDGLSWVIPQPSPGSTSSGQLPGICLKVAVHTQGPLIRSRDLADNQTWPALISRR